MFIQVVQGKVSDPDHLQRQLEAWRKDVKPGAAGYLGSTGGVTPDGRSIAIVRFESEAAARANSERPEQAEWWAEASKAYDGDVTFHDCRDVDTAFGGGSDKAGFVQVIQARAKNQEEMRALRPELEADLQKRRPDILGMVVAWHGDGGGFTQAVYFESVEAARKGETATEADDRREQFMGMMDGPPTFFDLESPDYD